MIIWPVLIIIAYLLGSVPASYLAAKTKGIDLRQYGTTQVGGGNLYRMTSSWKLALPVAIFDAGKGMLMIWIAQTQDLDVAQQLTVGLAAVVGHNWPVFLRFHGGRGIGTTMGIVTILPVINEMSPWPAVAFWVCLAVGRLLLGSTPLPVLIGVIIEPVLSWIFKEPLGVILGFTALFLVIVIKRLSAQPQVEAVNIGQGRLLLNRFFFDRDIRDKKVWMYRKPIAKQEPWED